MRSGSSPKKRRKNSSPKNSSNGVRPGTVPRDSVLILMTDGLIVSATAANDTVGSGICTGTMGAWI